MVLFLQKPLTYIKKYWELIFLAVSAVAAFFFFRREQDGFSERLKKLQDAHDEQIKKITQAREEERRQHEENLKLLQETLDSIQKQYDEAKKTLDEKKKKQIAQMVKSYGNEPDQLAKKLSEVTGFKVIMPDR